MKSTEQDTITDLHIAGNRQELSLLLQHLAARLQPGELNFICYTGEQGFLLELKCVPFHYQAATNNRTKER